MNKETSPIDRINSWLKNSISLKLFVITILMLLLLIPSTMIQSIIHERESLSNQAIVEVSNKWAGSQQINGPIVSIPLIYEYKDEDKTYETTKYLHILPEELDINGNISPEKLKRGIYEIVVYKSKLALSGTFLLNKEIDKNNLKEIKYDQAFLTIGISDLRGIEDQVILNWDKKDLKVEPGSRISELIYSGITVKLPNIETDINKSINFSFSLNLQGSQNLNFIPLGSTTNVKIKSDWPFPSFNGNFLPDHRNVTDTGFEADWKVLQLNRNFPQSWIGNKHADKIGQSNFGVNLILPLDDYKKSVRSSKYAVMCIALTFLIFFLVEIINRRKIHPFQYILVGLALCIFYVLLISISEHSNFNTAYIISSISIVGMISLYSLTILKSKKLSLLLMATLASIYGFLFVTLQLADYALLMGSIGLTLILAATMYFTRNINWYEINIDPK
ncbi:cell envelope integrity protein CreD [Ancylomarina salipaludis]|uniref:Cell envelope integrity protein CreD n=1 Tax=Ancylomarina salipaludis TaxID=2501299 RepID=A0A4Q1JRX4_9BACT|nr:cell envelope integrity protein CreD [Ancylomarina salipaludis]RXQ97651.1 cell envelope integrity protein CreD [Ancylomarina salipaludis]